MLLGKASPEDVNLHPIRYQWAYDLYNQAVRNTWFPHEIALGEDVRDFEAMTPDEQHAVKFLMAFFNPAELIVNRSIALGIYPYLKAPECHLYLAKQMWEEANHCVSFEYVLQTFGFDRTKIFKVHTETPSMTAKEDFINYYVKRMTETTLDIETDDGKRDFIRNIVATNIVMEGVWFYSGFMVALSFRQRNQLRNFGSMIAWVLRDESLHLKFGINLVTEAIAENAHVITSEFADEIREMIIKGVDLEVAYNKDLFPRGILGLNADYVNQYVKYVADRRLEEIGFEPHFNVTNPAKWMATATDVHELVNFFEMQNTSYEVDSHAQKSGEIKKEE